MADLFSLKHESFWTFKVSESDCHSILNYLETRPDKTNIDRVYESPNHEHVKNIFEAPVGVRYYHAAPCLQAFLCNEASALDALPAVFQKYVRDAAKRAGVDIVHTPRALMDLMIDGDTIFSHINEGGLDRGLDGREVTVVEGTGASIMRTAIRIQTHARNVQRNRMVEQLTKGELPDRSLQELGFSSECIHAILERLVFKKIPVNVAHHLKRLGFPVGLLLAKLSDDNQVALGHAIKGGDLSEETPLLVSIWMEQVKAVPKLATRLPLWILPVEEQEKIWTLAIRQGKQDGLALLNSSGIQDQQLVAKLRIECLDKLFEMYLAKSFPNKPMPNSFNSLHIQFIRGYLSNEIFLTYLFAKQNDPRLTPAHKEDVLATLFCLSKNISNLDWSQYKPREGLGFNIKKWEAFYQLHHEIVPQRADRYSISRVINDMDDCHLTPDFLKYVVGAMYQKREHPFEGEFSRKLRKIARFPELLAQYHALIKLKENGDQVVKGLVYPMMLLLPIKLVRLSSGDGVIPVSEEQMEMLKRIFQKIRAKPLRRGLRDKLSGLPRTINQACLDINTQEDLLILENALTLSDKDKKDRAIAEKVRQRVSALVLLRKATQMGTLAPGWTGADLEKAASQYWAAELNLEKVDRTKYPFNFGRYPGAIDIYAVNQCDDEGHLPEDLKTFVRSAIQGNYYKDRYDPFKSRHLSWMSALPKFKDWKEGGKPIPFTVKGAVELTADRVREQLQFSLIHNHIVGPELRASVEGMLEGRAPSTEFETALLRVLETPSSETLDEVINLLHSAEAQLQTDLRALIPKKAQYAEAMIVDTDDAQDMLLCGTEVEGSCQQITGNPSLNRCVTSLLLDGKYRMIAVKNREGQIIGRQLLRWMYTEDKKPALFLERHYGDPSTAAAIQMYAMARAKELALPLYKVGKGGEAGTKLVSKGSPAAAEYVDATRDIEEGPFVISDAEALVGPREYDS